MEERNAIIKSVTLTIEDHGILTAWLNLGYGGSAQGFGGYALYTPKMSECFAGRFIWRVLETVGVREWNELSGKPIRVRASLNGVRAIGHIIEDRWFVPSEECP